MSLPPLPPQNTRRVFYDLSTDAQNFTVQVRVADPVTASEVDGQFAALMAALGPDLYSTSLIRVREAQRDSTFSFDRVWQGGGTTTWGAFNEPPAAAPEFISFVGRSGGGRRVRLFVFSWKGGINSDYRLVNTERVNDALTVLRANLNTFRAIDGLTPIWNNYANLGLNAFKQRRQRRQ